MHAGVAKLADARDSKSRGAIRAGSSPATGTSLDVHNDIQKRRIVFVDCPCFLFTGYRDPVKVFWVQKTMLAGIG